jgi:hypothetical protein
MTPMDVTLGVFLASLAGSPHCAAMCGPFLAFAAADGDGPGANGRATPLLAYHGGRLVSYVLLGAGAGALGAGLEQLGRLAGLGRVAALSSRAWGHCPGQFARGSRASPRHSSPADGCTCLSRLLGGPRHRCEARWSW